MRVIQIGFPTTFRPILSKETASKEIIDNCFEKLVTYEGLKIVPCLAESWEIKDGLEYSFSIRKNVYFHNRILLTPFLVYKSICNTLDSINEYVFEVKGIIKNIYFNDNQVVFSLKRKNTLFLHFLAMHYFSISYIENINSKDPYMIEIGTGPYFISKYEPNHAIELTSFDGYWRVLPKIKKIQITYIDSVEERKSILDNRSAEIVHCNFQLPAHDKEYYSEIKNYSCDNFVLGFNFRKKEFNNKNIRKAFSLMFPYEEYTSRLNNEYMPLNGIVPNILLKQKKLVHQKCDLDAAEKKLKMEDFDFSKQLILLNCKGLTYRLTALELLKRNLSLIGIKSLIVEKTWVEFLNSLDNGEFDLAYMSYAPDFADAQCFFDAMISENGAISKRIGFRDSSYTNLSNKVFSELDTNKRNNLIEELNNKIINDCIYIGLVQGIDTKIIRKDLRGFVYSPFLGDYYFYDMNYSI